MTLILQTPRLLLREFERTDADSMYRLNADPEVIRYTGDPPFDSVEAAQAFLTQYTHYKEHGYGRWAVVTQDNAEFIGWCGLKYHEADFIDLGFRFFRNEWNKGYATEAAHACLAYGFETLHMQEIIGRADKANLASIRVLEKLGMHFWKEAVFDHHIQGMYYRINQEQFLNR